MYVMHVSDNQFGADVKGLNLRVHKWIVQKMEDLAKLLWRLTIILQAVLPRHGLCYVSVVSFDGAHRRQDLV